jgi:plasmid stabilization system protein ParE
MAKPIIFAPQARAEVNVAARRYGEERPELRVEFHVAVKEALDRMVRLSRHLGTPPLVAAGLGIKRVFVERFPFSVYFIELPDRFRVLAVAHGRRMPFYWRERL